MCQRRGKFKQGKWFSLPLRAWLRLTDSWHKFSEPGECPGTGGEDGGEARGALVTRAWTEWKRDSTFLINTITKREKRKKAH